MCQHSKQVIEMAYEDSKHSMRNLTISGIVDYLGIAYATITNELKQTYFAVVDVFGDYGECSCASTSVCYHLQALFSIVDQLPKYEEVEETTSLEEVMAVAQAEMEIHIEQVAAKAEKVNEVKLEAYRQQASNAYAVLGATKQVSGDYDLCTGCQCRVKKGQKWCPNC
jgi:hypothetical protein